MGRPFRFCIRALSYTSRFSYFADWNFIRTTEQFSRRLRSSGKSRGKIDPLCAQRAADWINRLGRPAPSIRPLAATSWLLLKELPACGGFGDIVVSATRLRRHRRFRNAPAVLGLILLNTAAFIFEISFGSWTDPEVLHHLGALEPYAVVVQGQYWRLFTALFLHAGFVHLLFNLFALYVLGPPLERSIGAIRFAICYLISGLVSSAGVVGLTVIGLVQVAQLVGASGCIMGIVGAWAGFLLRHRHAPHAKQRLGNVVMIVAIQTAFDLSTPQVSMAAHLCGLVAGFVLGLALTPRAAR